jgi:hypothetical protein
MLRLRGELGLDLERAIEHSLVDRDARQTG